MLHLDMSQGKAVSIANFNSLLDGILMYYEKLYQLTPKPDCSFGTRMSLLIQAAHLPVAGHGGWLVRAVRGRCGRLSPP